MRLLISLPDRSLAENLSRHLSGQGIENRVGEPGSPETDVWVFDEDQMDRAASVMTEFLANPQAAPTQPVAPGPPIQATPDRFQKIDVRKKVFEKTATGGTITIALILVSALTSMSPYFAESPNKDLPQLSPIYQLFYMTEIKTESRFIMGEEKLMAGADMTLPEIRRGQAWRLITPIFLHFGFLHLFFNMIMLFQLGAIIELIHGSRFLFFLVFVTGIFSNLCQFGMLTYYSDLPTFGGMSGVLYALFGFLWIRSKRDPAYPIRLNRDAVVMMIAWAFLGVIGGYVQVGIQMANTAHFSGLLSGMAIARLVRKK